MIGADRSGRRPYEVVRLHPGDPHADTAIGEQHLRQASPDQRSLANEGAKLRRRRPGWPHGQSLRA
jgi:hypothetical protein